MIEKFPSYAATASFIAIAIVVAHEWAYFGVIGPDFQSLYSTYDYLALLVVWIGPSFIFLMIFSGLQLSLSRSSDFREPAAKSRAGAFFAKWYMEIIYTLIIIFTFTFYDETRRFAVYVLLALIWYRVVNYIFSHELFKTLSLGAHILAGAIPALMLVSYGSGRDQAYADLKPSKNYYDLQMKGERVVHKVVALRFIESGIIVIAQDTRTINFVPKDLITSIGRPSPAWDTTSFACRHWAIACPSLLKK